MALLNSRNLGWSHDRACVVAQASLSPNPPSAITQVKAERGSETTAPVPCYRTRG